MADNVIADPGAGGATFASDDIGGVQYPRTKITLGGDGVNDGDVCLTNPMPSLLVDALGNPIDPRLIRAIASGTDSISVPGIDVNLSTRATEATLAALNAKVTAVNTGAVTVAASALPAGAATEATLAAVKAKTDNLDVALSTRAADATLTGGTAKAIARGGAKGATAAADLTGTAQGADHQALDVQIYHGGAAKDPTQIRALTAADVVTVGGSLPAGTNNIGDVDVLSMPAIVGGKTNDNAAPGATNIGALIAIANEALAAYTEGNLVLPRVDLRGVFRTVAVPMAHLGIYEVVFNTGVYNGLAANTPLWSMRWGDATRFAMLLRFEIAVVTSTAATTAGVTERQLIPARSFTASDTGGTGATLTGNNQKRRTSMGTSLLTDMRWGAPITAGTRTLDAQAIATALGWSGLLSTGFVIGACGSSAVGAARSTEGGVQMHPFYNALNGQDHPQTFAQNEGVVMRIGRAQPAAAVQETFGRVLWLEANKIL